MTKRDKLQGQADINSILQTSANKVICQLCLLLVPWKYEMNRNREWIEWYIVLGKSNDFLLSLKRHKWW